jgi:CheY-like chemotaxis protein
LVYSEIGRGTTFKIYLPAAEYKLDRAPAAEATALPPRAHGEMILLVEDDSLMRTLTRQMLEEHGYRVLEASDGADALAKLRESGAHLDAVLSDVVMPGMSGPDLVSELTRLFPAAKVVYMSGYTGELMTQNGEKKREAPLLDKPFTRLSLLEAMHSALH